MAPRPGGEQQQDQQRLTQANLQQHAQANPSVPHPTGGRLAAAVAGKGDGRPGTGANPAGSAGPEATPATKDGRGAAAPLERGLSAAVEHAANEGKSVSTGLPLDASTYTDDTLTQHFADAASAILPSQPSRDDRGRDMAAAAAAAVATVDAERSAGERGAARAEYTSHPEQGGEQTAAERAADGGVSVSTGLPDDASMATDTTVQHGTAPERRSFDSTLAPVSEVGPAEEAARDGVSISTGLHQQTSVASDTTVNSRGGQRHPAHHCIPECVSSQLSKVCTPLRQRRTDAQ